MIKYTGASACMQFFVVRHELCAWEVSRGEGSGGVGASFVSFSPKKKVSHRQERVNM